MLVERLTRELGRVYVLDDVRLAVGGELVGDDRARGVHLNRVLNAPVVGELGLVEEVARIVVLRSAGHRGLKLRHSAARARR